MIYIFYLYIQWPKPTVHMEWAVFTFRKGLNRMFGVGGSDGRLLIEPAILCYCQFWMYRHVSDLYIHYLSTQEHSVQFAWLRLNCFLHFLAGEIFWFRKVPKVCLATVFAFLYLIHTFRPHTIKVPRPYNSCQIFPVSFCRRTQPSNSHPCPSKSRSLRFYTFFQRPAKIAFKNRVRKAMRKFRKW